MEFVDGFVCEGAILISEGKSQGEAFFAGGDSFCPVDADELKVLELVGGLFIYGLRYPCPRGLFVNNYREVALDCGEAGDWFYLHGDSAQGHKVFKIQLGGGRCEVFEVEFIFYCLGGEAGGPNGSTVYHDLRTGLRPEQFSGLKENISLAVDSLYQALDDTAKVSQVAVAGQGEFGLFDWEGIALFGGNVCVGDFKYSAGAVTCVEVCSEGGEQRWQKGLSEQTGGLP